MEQQTADTAIAAAAAAAHAGPSTLTVDEVTLQRARTSTKCALGSALTRWVQACGIASKPGSVRVIELLPHYASLLSLLDNLHSDKVLTAKTVYKHLLALSLLFEKYKEHWQCSCRVEYAAMLDRFAAARRKYSRLSKEWENRPKPRQGQHPGKQQPQQRQQQQQRSAGADVGEGVAAAPSTLQQGCTGLLTQQPGLEGASMLEAAAAASSAELLPAAADATAAAAGGATPTQLQDAASTSTVKEVWATGSDRNLQGALQKWMKSCGIVGRGGCGSVRLAELLPHYAKVQSLLKIVHSRKQLTAKTVHSCLKTLYTRTAELG